MMSFLSLSRDSHDEEEESIEIKIKQTKIYAKDIVFFFVFAGNIAFVCFYHFEIVKI